MLADNHAWFVAVRLALFQESRLGSYITNSNPIVCKIIHITDLVPEMQLTNFNDKLGGWSTSLALLRRKNLRDRHSAVWINAAANRGIDP